MNGEAVVVREDMGTGPDPGLVGAFVLVIVLAVLALAAFCQGQL